MSVEKVLSLKVGSPVILLCNLSQYLVNGRRGVVEKLETDGPTVNFAGRVVKIGTYNFIEGSAKRVQYPLKLAYALTIHRAQGQTLDNVVIDCKDLFAPGQLGVAVGRATKIEGLQVLNYSRKVSNILHSPLVYKFYAAEKGVSSHCCRKKNVDDTGMQCDTDFKPLHDKLTFEQGSGIAEPDEDVVYVKDILNKVKICATHLTKKQEEFNSALNNISEYLSVHRLFVSFKNTLPEKFFHMSGMASKEQTEVYQAIHAFFMTSEFTEHLKSVFKRDITALENNIGTKLIQTWVDIQLAHQLDKKEQQASVVGKQSTVKGEKPIPDDVRSKVRYIGGACTAKLAYKFQVKLRNSLYMQSTINKAQKNTNQIAMKLFQGLHVIESDIVSNTTDAASLEETARKQNVNRALKNISDEAFNFFLHVYRFIMNSNTDNMLAKHEGSALNVLIKQLRNCDLLLAEWIQMTAEPETDDLYVSVQLDTFDCVMKWFGKVWMKDYVAMKKPDMVKSKQAETNLPLRTFIKGASSKRQLQVKEQPVPTRKSSRKQGKKSVKYPCGICSKNVTEAAVACDSCDKWYHYRCLNIEADDETLVQDIWYCESCK